MTVHKQASDVRQGGFLGRSYVSVNRSPWAFQQEEH